MLDLETGLREAVKHFWSARQKQGENQGGAEGDKDRGNRSSVTGGKQLHGFANLVRDILLDAGLRDAEIHTRRNELPGYFRATKDWDLVAVVGEHLLASVEFKSQCGPSYGNNFNNRTEEALGNALDLKKAYEHGAFKPSARPWVGYLMLLEQEPRSTTPVRVVESHFKVFPEFHSASYAKRYELLCERLVREQLYDSACFLMSARTAVETGDYITPNEELGFKAFAAALAGHAFAYGRLRNS